MKPAANKPTLTPKLRFPEFRGGGGWELKNLGDLFSQREETGCADLRLLSLTDVEGIIPQEDSGRKNNASVDRSKYLRVVPGDIAYNTMRMWEGRSARAAIEGLVSPAYTVCKPNDETDSLFFAYYFKTQQLIEQFARYSQGLVKDTLNLKYESFSRIVTAAPRSPEQQKIATCLSSLDDLIGVESRKLDTLKAHKKGLMQELFPREGETVPRLRFPEFRKAGKWETKAGGVLFTNRKEDGEKGLPIYSVTLSDGMIPRASFDRDFNDIEDPAGNKKAFKGDIVYNMMRMWQGAQGVAPEDCMVSPAYVVLSPRSGVCSDFFAYLFKLPQSLRLLTATSRGLTKDRLRLYYDDFSRMRLCVPSFKEQRRIAACLSALDDLIAAQSDKLESLKTHKKGLMQQLFPSPASESVGA